MQINQQSDTKRKTKKKNRRKRNGKRSERVPSNNRFFVQLINYKNLNECYQSENQEALAWSLTLEIFQSFEIAFEDGTLTLLFIYFLFVFILYFFFSVYLSCIRRFIENPTKRNQNWIGSLYTKMEKNCNEQQQQPKDYQEH